MKKTITIFVIITCIIFACKKKIGNISPGTPVNFDVPVGFPKPVYDFTSNPLTVEGIELGRKLFYEGKLSKDGNFACSNCHMQNAAFGTYDHDLSHGYNNSHTKRNAPPLLNLAWQNTFYADGSIDHLDAVTVAHIISPIDMAETLASVNTKLNADIQYRYDFKKAFGTDEVTTVNIAKAISQFLLTMVTANSKYDNVKKGTATFTADENAGYQLFKTNCTGCHTEPLFTNFSFRNIGLPINTSLNDFGRLIVTKKSSDSLKFKVPSLRNVAWSFPYTHDGYVFDLSNMIDHYRNKVINGPTTDDLVKNKIPLSITEKGQIISFLRTLTDEAFLTNPKLGRP